MINKVFKIEEIGNYKVFQSKDHRFYVNDNKIYKKVIVDITKIEEEW